MASKDPFGDLALAGGLVKKTMAEQKASSMVRQTPPTPPKPAADGAAGSPALAGYIHSAAARPSPPKGSMGTSSKNSSTGSLAGLVDDPFAGLGGISKPAPMAAQRPPVSQSPTQQRAEQPAPVQQFPAAASGPPQSASPSPVPSAFDLEDMFGPAGSAQQQVQPSKPAAVAIDHDDPFAAFAKTAAVLGKKGLKAAQAGLAQLETALEGMDKTAAEHADSSTLHSSHQHPNHNDNHHQQQHPPYEDDLPAERVLSIAIHISEMPSHKQPDALARLPAAVRRKVMALLQEQAVIQAEELCNAEDPGRSAPSKAASPAVASRSTAPAGGLNRVLSGSDGQLADLLGGGGPAVGGSAGRAAATHKSSSMTNLGGLEALAGHVDVSGHQDLYDDGSSQRGDGDEPELRRQLRAARAAEKHAKMKAALAEKQAKEAEEVQRREQQQAHKLAHRERIETWRNKNKGNVRGLLSSLQTVLWEDSGWKPIGMADLLERAQVRKAWMKANLLVHPDKVRQRNGGDEQVAIADMIFDALKEAWGQFKG
eukprot:gene10949-11103_t